MAYETKNNGENGRNSESIFSKMLRAGKRRTYFFDVRATRRNDYFLTITESKKHFDEKKGKVYERYKLHLYKEDFNKFVSALNECVDYVKTELLPDFDFDSYRPEPEEEGLLSLAAEPTESLDSPDLPQEESEKTQQTDTEKAYFNLSDSEEEPQGSSVEDWKL